MCSAEAIMCAVSACKSEGLPLRKAPVLIKCNNQPYQKETVKKLTMRGQIRPWGTIKKPFKHRK